MLELLIIAAVAVESFSDFLVTVPQLEPARKWFETDFNIIGNLARCKYCQTFWLSILVALVFPQVPDLNPIVSFLVVVFSVHRVAQSIDGLFERHLPVLRTENEEQSHEEKQEETDEDEDQNEGREHKFQ